mmetsp:Transcript_14457/g.20382  ORF Transcript_14457/g.20382 Transcript_14457/m.20382 type:complete len:513 (+) Transcript_14457:15-1553(+)
MAELFTFNCVICIEQFDNEERYPVVLPCGHTYLCHHCAQRLDKCTECRASLTEEIPQPRKIAPSSTSCRKHAQASPSNKFRMSQMYGSSRSVSSIPYESNRQMATPQADSNSNPTSQVVKKRLPLPKNLVLLKLMESATLPSITKDRDQPKEIADEQDIASSCGSYIVKALEGLQIVPIRPTINSLNEEAQDTDSLVSSFYLDYGQLLETANTENNFLPPDVLLYGDTVQVVWIDQDGWAKLARGYGYVKAGTGDLVRVGEPKDETCKLEGQIHSIISKKRQTLSHLRKENKKFDNEQEIVAKKLREALVETEDQTVVSNEEESTSKVLQVLTFEDSISSVIEVFDAERLHEWNESKPEILRFHESAATISVMGSDIDESDTENEAAYGGPHQRKTEESSQVFRPVPSSPENEIQSLSRCNADDDRESFDVQDLVAPSTPKKKIIDSNIRTVDFRGLSSHGGLQSARKIQRSNLNRSASDVYRSAFSYASISNHSGLSTSRRKITSYTPSAY